MGSTPSQRTLAVAPRPLEGARRYLFPVAVAVAAAVAAWALKPSSPTGPLLALLPVAVALAARRGGLGPGLLAMAVLSLPAALATLRGSAGGDVLPWILSTLGGIAIAALAAGERRFHSSSPPPARNLLARQLQVSALEAEASRLQRFARDAPIGIVYIRRDGTVQYANDEYLRIVHVSRDEFEGERFRSRSGGPAGWLHDGLGERHETELLRSDGTRVPVLVGVSSQEDGLAAFVVDLSAERAAQRAREESEARYRATAEKLVEADRRKDEFLGVLSHELRNPLAPIRTAVYILRRTDASGDGARRQKVLAVIERQVDHLARLVDDLLDVTRITRGRVELRRERLDLTDLVMRTGDDHRAMAHERGLELVVTVPQESTWVDGDPTRLMQIVGNLLQNAVKFSARGGRVALALEARADGADIRVADTGVGIDPDLLGHVFEPFVQAERTLARSDGGLGLGLALVRALTVMHGGSVQASSGGSGAGAEFVVHLPLAPPAAEAAHVPRPAITRPVDRSRVLVVEDNQDAAESLGELVQMFGHEVEVAYTGPAALAKARANPPDVVLCDIGLPGMSGYDVARAFRGDPALRHARLVAVSGYALREDRVRSQEAGFDRHVAKPPDIDELERLLAPGERATGDRAREPAAREPRSGSPG